MPAASNSTAENVELSSGIVTVTVLAALDVDEHSVLYADTALLQVTFAGA